MADGEERDVSADPSLGPEERQVSLVSTAADDEFRVHAEVPSWVRWLHRHPAARVESTREVDGSLVACTATVPVGLLKLQASPRSSDQFGRALSNATLEGRDGGVE